MAKDLNKFNIEISRESDENTLLFENNRIEEQSLLINPKEVKANSAESTLYERNIETTYLQPIDKQDSFYDSYVNSDETLIVEIQNKKSMITLYLILGIIMLFVFIPLGIIFLFIYFYNRRKYSLQVLLTNKRIIIKNPAIKKKQPMSFDLKDIEYIAMKKHIFGANRTTIIFSNKNYHSLDNLSNVEYFVNTANDIIQKTNSGT